MSASVVSPAFIKRLPYVFSLVFDIDEDVIKIYYYKDIKLFRQKLVDIVLKYSWYIGQSKKYHMVLKIAIASLENCLLFIFFSNLHLIVNISQIKLSKMLSPTQSI